MNQTTNNLAAYIWSLADLFYVYQPPRDLAEIDADPDKVGAEIMKLLQEVHS